MKITTNSIVHFTELTKDEIDLVRKIVSNTNVFAKDYTHSKKAEASILARTQDSISVECKNKSYVSSFVAYVGNELLKNDKGITFHQLCNSIG